MAKTSTTRAFISDNFKSTDVKEILPQAPKSSEEGTRPITNTKTPRTPRGKVSEREPAPF